MTRYFAEEDPPVQLAAVRVIVFATALMVLAQADPLEYVGLPGELTKAPFPWQRLLAGVSFPLGFSAAVLGVFTAACVCGLFGLFTRTAALTAALSGIYILGVPQSFGKVNHFHIVIWFPALLAMSRAGDFYSLDAIWRRERSLDAACSSTWRHRANSLCRAFDLAVVGVGLRDSRLLQNLW